MSSDSSAWSRYPGYRIDLVPSHSLGKVTRNGVTLAQSKACLLVQESDHDARLYFPEADVLWEHFSASDHQTHCPFKGDASYWSLAVADDTVDNVIWTYRDPLPQVAGLSGYVSFDTEQLQVELIQNWSGEPEHAVSTRFPIWGDAQDLLSLLDVQPVSDKCASDSCPSDTGSPQACYRSQPYPNPPIGTFIESLKEKRRRSVVEGGHQLSQAIVAASKTIPEQRVTSASMIFSKAASFEEPLDVKVDVLRRGRSFSTVEVKTLQQDQMRSTGLLLMDASPGDRIKQAIAMPEVAGPDAAMPLDMKVTGREIRIVDGAYTNDLDHVGPPELYAWIRFRDAPKEQYLNAALMTQATTHWTIAAALRPHPGLSQALAHVSLSTGPLKADISFHDDVDVSEWMLYVNDVVYSGKGQAQSQGKIFAIDGRLLASFAIHTMIRDFAGGGGKGHNAM